MNKIYFTVGPTELFSETKKYMLDALREKVFSISHRSEDFVNICIDTKTELKKLLDIPDDFYIFYMGSATECMERVIQNVVEKKSFHFINGYFAERFYNIAIQLKKKSYIKKIKYGEGFNFNKIVIPKETELICFTQNETSTGVAIDMNDIYRVKENNPDKMIAVDVVTSVPYVKIDFSKIDCAFFSVQKGFGLPPGLGVIIIRKSCIEKTRMLKEKNINIGSFHNFINLAANAEKNQTAVTPNISGIYLLGKVCKLMNEKGIENIRNDTDIKASYIYDFFEKHKFVSIFVENKKIRSKTTIVLDVYFDSDLIVDKMKKKGYVISKGYGNYKDKQIRIANFPMHKIDDVKRLLNAFGSI
jgi:phosphoserine aminotransferase